MKNMINVLMIDSESSIKEVKQYLGSCSNNINISYNCSDGIDAVNIIKEHERDIDIILMDTILPSLDGIGVLKFMNRENINKKVIIYSHFNNEALIKSLNLFDITFFLYKNVGKDVLVERINYAYKVNYQEYEFKPSSMTKTISKLLHDLGMPSHIKGYQYIRDSIELMYNNPDTLGGITKEVYPYIADKYNTTPYRVERAIRHAIEVSWNRGDYDLMEEIFGHSVDFDRAKPTNSEFLATVADKIHLDGNKVR